METRQRRNSGGVSVFVVLAGLVQAEIAFPRTTPM